MNKLGMLFISSLNIFANVDLKSIFLLKLDSFEDSKETANYPPASRDSGNHFCQISVLGYPKRYDFVPSRIQKKRPETTVV